MALHVLLFWFSKSYPSFMETGHKYVKLIPFFKKLRYIHYVWCSADSIEEVNPILGELIAFIYG